MSTPGRRAAQRCIIRRNAQVRLWQGASPDPGSAIQRMYWMAPRRSGWVSSVVLLLSDVPS